MHLLFVATSLPLPANNGQTIRNFSIIRGLKSIGHDVSFVCFANAGSSERVRTLSQYCGSVDVLEQEVATLAISSGHLRRLASLLALKSFSVDRFRSKPMRALIQKKLRDQQYDLLICDGIYALTNVPETKVPIILNCHNIEHVILKRYADLEPNPLKKYYALIESSFIRAAERRSFQHASSAMVCSSIDLELLRELRSDLPAVVVPNVVDTEHISPVNMPRADSNSILFQGGMDWYPNRDAVDFFVHKILPRVRLKCPGARLVVAGRNPSAEFLERFKADSLIEFTGTFADILTYLSAAQVVVVPLRMGGGTRIKILEACAAGKAVVSTSIGAEGLNLAPDKEIVLADDAEQFAAAVIGILQDPLRAEALGKSARAAVVDRYGMPALQNGLRALLAADPHSPEPPGKRKVKSGPNPSH